MSEPEKPRPSIADQEKYDFTAEDLVRFDAMSPPGDVPPGTRVQIKPRELRTLVREIRRRRSEMGSALVDSPLRPDVRAKEARKRVARAVIIRTEHGGAKKVLLTMRDGRSDFPNHWECPGGKVEAGETDAEALLRKLKEELDIYSAMVELKALGRVNLDPPVVKTPLVVAFHLVEVSPNNEPRALQSRCLAWFEPEALDALPLMPANRALCAKVKAACGMLVSDELPRTVEDALRDAGDIIGREPISGKEI